MKFTCIKEHLVRALKNTAGIAGRNSTLPILRNVLLKTENGRLKFSVTDLEVGVSTWVTGRVDGEGSTTIPLKQLAEYVQNLPNEHVNLETEKGTLLITCGSARASFQGEASENFPLIPTVTSGIKFTVSATKLLQALDRVMYAAATDDTRPELSGILWFSKGNVLTLAATDSYRLAEVQLEINETLVNDFRVILPLRTTQEIKRILDGEETVTLILAEGQALVETPNTSLVSRLIEGNYPDYQQIIPAKSGTTASVLRFDLLRALRGASVFSYGEVNSVLVETTDKAVKITATAQEIGETNAEVVADVTGEATKISFNPRFLIDALNGVPGERVRFGLTNAGVPALLIPEDPKEKTVALVMPIKN
ncbi:MAG: DNA polymerase III subunit beta [bacterium]|nr:DNA polymerase III subunit beta [bacterium]